MENKSPLDNLAVLVCRPALPKDTPQVLELTRTIWDGHDYVPYVWEDWLKDPLGLLNVAELGGVIVGIGKLTVLAPGQWWQEGLRVHPEYQGRGIASHIHKYQLEYWNKYGDGIIRLVTNSARKAVHHLCEQFGYAKRAEFTYYQSQSITEPSGSFLQVDINDIPSALEFVNANVDLFQSLSLSCGLMDLGWKFAAPTTQFIAEASSSGRIWWWRGRQGLVSYWLDDNDDTFIPTIQMIACPNDQIGEMLIDFRRLAGSHGYAQTAWLAPLNPDLHILLQTAGFSREWEDAVWLYQLPHPS